ncbi:MAG: lysozyme M1 (1,4-beta-N-acetylmuramidase) [Streptomycetaceae bacterium]|nr:MAG: lysozyme M1 (1,4-beta-N-acetylmuramidase) [Streptomycetaceae bacterium]
MKFKHLILAIVLAFTVIEMPSSSAVNSQLSMSLRQTPSASEALLTFYGTLSPAKSGINVYIYINTGGPWTQTRFKGKTTKAGTWKVEALATALDAKVQYRASVTVSGKKIYSPVRTITIKQIAEVAQADPALIITAVGPGGRIHGADISRWQHPNDKAIDFAKMYEAGIRFVMIKASDTREDADQLSLKYLIMDHSAAQAVGIYTGFYHYAILPDVSDSDGIVRDATAQAQKAIWRLASIGGYTQRDLPYALDLENKCVRLSTSGACQKYATRSAVTLWATTFLRLLKEKTGKVPILYSYSNFLESSMNRNAELAQYPLWLAQYAIDPSNPLNQPGLKASGCYVHSWTGAHCDSQWAIWQYTSCGIAPKYGVPGSRLDLNLFRGSANDFLGLVQGSWTPQVVDFMPTNEPSTLTVNTLSASTTNKLVTFNVTVVRPDLTPVVTGSVKLVFDPINAPTNKPIQTVLRETSGSWTLAVKDVLAGTYTGQIVFTDVSQTHAQSFAPVIFTVVQGPTPSPTPKSTIKATPQPSADECAKQIKN